MRSSRHSSVAARSASRTPSHAVASRAPRRAASSRTAHPGRRVRRGEIERVERPLLVERRFEPRSALEAEQCVPHLLEHRTKRGLAREEPATVTPAGCLHRVNERSRQSGELVGLGAGRLEATNLVEKGLELYRAKAQERVVPARRERLDQRGVESAAGASEVGRVLTRLERVVRANRRPERAHRRGKRLAACPRGQIAIVGDGVRELRSRRESAAARHREPRGAAGARYQTGSRRRTGRPRACIASRSSARRERLSASTDS